MGELESINRGNFPPKDFWIYRVFKTTESNISCRIHFYFLRYSYPTIQTVMNFKKYFLLFLLVSKLYFGQGADKGK